MAATTWTLWQVLEGMPKALPLNQPKVERLFNTTLAEKSRNEHMHFLAGGKGELAGGVAVSAVDLRLPTDTARPAFLVVDLAGPCIGMADVRTRYPALELTEAPRGRSAHDAAVYTATLPWGTLSFSFKQSNPDCVAQVVVAPR